MMRMERFRIMLLIFLVIFTGVAPVSFAGPPGTYQQQSLYMGEKIGLILISHGLCTDINDCNKKRIRFVGRTTTGMDVEVFNISDASIIEEIIAVCLDAYAKNQQKITVHLSVYRQSHEKMMGFAKWYRKPFVKLHLQGERE